MAKKVKYKVDNKMKLFGQANLDTGEIKINKKKNKAAGKGELLDTIVHEKLHIKHPKMSEKNIRKKTPIVLKKLSKKSKQQLFNKLNSPMPKIKKRVTKKHLSKKNPSKDRIGRKGTPAQNSKVAKVLDEFNAGTLRSSAGELVTTEDQAIAIGLSEAGLSNK